MVKVSASFVKPLKSGNVAVPQELFKHKMFETYHEQLCWETKRIWPIHGNDSNTIKELLRRLLNTREFLQDTFEESPLATVMALSTIARTIWIQNTKLEQGTFGCE